MATLGEYLGAGSGTTKLLLHLNGNSNDSSGNENNGTDTNTTYSQDNGKFGQGVECATNGRVYIADNLGINGSNITISVWLKATSEVLSDDYNIVAGQGDATSKVYQQIIYRNVAGTNSFLFSRNKLGVSATQASYVITLDTDKIYNVIYTYDGTNVRGYLNGSLVAGPSAASGNGTDSKSGNHCGINIEVYNSIVYNVGATTADELIIENRAWSDSEIKKYYTYTKGRFNL